MKRFLLLLFVLTATLLLFVTGVYAAEIDWSLYPYSIYKSEFENAELYVEETTDNTPGLVLIKKTDSLPGEMSSFKAIVIDKAFKQGTETGVLIAELNFIINAQNAVPYLDWSAPFVYINDSAYTTNQFSLLNYKLTYSESELVFKRSGYASITFKHSTTNETSVGGAQAVSNEDYKKNLLLFGNGWDDEISKRAYMGVSKSADGAGYAFEIHWSSSAEEYSRWTMTVYYNEKTDLFEYNDGVESIVYYDPIVGGESVKTEHTNGSGYFKLVNGKLFFHENNKSSATCVFSVASLDDIEITPASAGSLNNFNKARSYRQGQFADVQPSVWYSESVKYAYELGLVNGSSSTTFKPNGNLSVIEALALACRIHSIYYTGKANFVQADPWYQVYLDYAVAYDIVGLYQNYVYRDSYAELSVPATREYFAEILHNALPPEALKNINGLKYGDIPDVTDNEAVYALYNAGILTGSDDYGTFNPDSSIKRSEVAAIITRMADENERKTVKFTLSPEDVYYNLIYVQIKAGESQKITPSISPLEAVGAPLSFSSSNPNVATVSKDGTITGKTAGTAVITAKASNGKSGSIEVFVTGTIETKPALPDISVSIEGGGVISTSRKTLRVSSLSYVYGTDVYNKALQGIHFTVNVKKTSDSHGNGYRDTTRIYFILYKGEEVVRSGYFSSDGLVVGEEHPVSFFVKDRLPSGTYTIYFYAY